MHRLAIRSALPVGALLLAIAACGGDGGGGGPPVTGVGTLAYVETECRDTKQGFVERQRLRIRQGDNEPVTVLETPDVGPITQIGGLCRAVTEGRDGDAAIVREAIQSVAVSPDGGSVVFEVTDEFSLSPPLPLHLPPDKKGIFWVRADGTGLRPLGSPSRTRFAFDGGFVTTHLTLSPNGRTVAFVDKAPDADGHEADQVVTIDVNTGTRTQVTHLPPAVPPPPYPPDASTIWGPGFVDDHTIGFSSCANPNALNPGGTYLNMTIQTDRSRLDVPLPVPVALGGGVITLQFFITGDRPRGITVDVPFPPTNDPPLPGWGPNSREIFLVDEGRNVLQLTNFRRVDTGGGVVDVDREQISFVASADPLGTNPSYNCQVFSIDRLGTNLRQLTNFRETEHSLEGCSAGRLGRGCFVYYPTGFQDPRSRALLFASSCDPLGQNPNGYEIFAIQPDGSGLRQLTDSRGLVMEADGTYSGELPGPWGYGPYVPSGSQ